MSGHRTGFQTESSHELVETRCSEIRFLSPQKVVESFFFLSFLVTRCH